MSRKRFVALGSGIVAVIAVALVVLNVGTPAGMIAGPHDGNMRASVGVKLVLEVHRADGETQTYVKEGDLVLLNFAHLLVKLAIGNDDPEGEDDVTYTDGTVGQLVWSANTANATIYLGNATTVSPAISDYKLVNPVVSFPIQNADILVNGNNMTVDIYGSYVVSSAINVTEIGLAFINYYDSNKPALMFHDALPTPVQLNAGDSITVHYYIFISNP